MLNGGHIYLESIMASITKNQLIVGEYVVLTHESANRKCWR